MKILLVEDDQHLRIGLSELLMLEGHTVVSAGDVASGLQTFEKEQPSFCIFDVMLPDKDGYELCREVRQLDPQVAILMLSARGEEIDRVLGFESGADDYVTKPFGPRELMMRIEAIARRTQPGRQAEQMPIQLFQMHDLEIDPASLRATRNNQVVELTVRELRLLALLYEKAGKVVSRDEIFDFCWGRSFVPNSRALDQYLSSLRRKIEVSPNGPQIIQTVRGAGYRYDPDSDLT